jgi:hypothetical protein
MITPTMTLEQIRIVGLGALMDKLGPIGTIRFLQQFESGTGDYSSERHQWLDAWNIDAVIKQLRQRQKPTTE